MIGMIVRILGKHQVRSYEIEIDVALKCLGSIGNPKGIFRYSKRPKWVITAVLQMSSGFTNTWWKAFAKSILEKTGFLLNLVQMSEIKGIG